MSASKELSQRDVGVCEISGIGLPTGDVGVSEDSEINVNEPVVVPSANRCLLLLRSSHKRMRVSVKYRRLIYLCC